MWELRNQGGSAFPAFDTQLHDHLSLLEVGTTRSFEGVGDVDRFMRCLCNVLNWSKHLFKKNGIVKNWMKINQTSHCSEQ